MKIAVLQLKASKPDPTTIMGRYVLSTLARKRDRNYHTFDDGCWDVPTWCINILQRMEKPSFLLEYPYAAIAIAGEHDQIFGSVMSIHSEEWLTIVASNPSTAFILGGYIDKRRFAQYPNVIWCDNIQQVYGIIANRNNLWKIVNPYYYPQLDSSDSINGVRLTLSEGCLHGCSFCVIPHKGEIIERSLAEIKTSIRPLMGKNIGMIYVDDKTFGQADNYRLLDDINQLLQPTGFVVQTTALHISKIGTEGIREWKNMGIKFVEFGLETFNDSILKSYKKPAREETIREAVHILYVAGMGICPNVIVGLKGETIDTYDHTVRFMGAIPEVAWFNLYCLADYHKTGIDADEFTPFNNSQTRKEADIAYYGFNMIYSRAINRQGGFPV